MRRGLIGISARTSLPRQAKFEPLLYLAWLKVEVGELDETALMLSLRTREAV